MKVIAIASVFALAASGIVAAPLPSATQIIQKEGQFAFTDGSSYYLFKKDGTFSSGPVSLSGRTISGRWTGQDDSFTVNGRWGWVNGVSALNDFRRMKLSATPEAVEPVVKNQAVLGMGVRAKLYRCYFVVDEIVPTQPPFYAPRAKSADDL